MAHPEQLMSLKWLLQHQAILNLHLTMLNSVGPGE
jgi:hypothetical protein